MNSRKDKTQAGFAFLTVVLLLIALAIACGESDEDKAIKEKVTISAAYCSKYTKDFLPYLTCYATVTNNSDKRLKDIDLKWSFLSKTDNELHSESATIMEYFEPGKPKSVRKSEIPDPSLISDDIKQTAKYKCTIEKINLADK